MSAVYFVCPDSKHPRGGIKEIYRHASILRKAGVDAWVLHDTRSFSGDWFTHGAGVAFLHHSSGHRVRRTIGNLNWRLRRFSPSSELALKPGSEIRIDGTTALRRLDSEDTVVFPEVYGAQLDGACAECPVVVFNQGVFGTFNGYGYGTRPMPNVYAQRNTVGAICVSEHSRRYLHFAFPNLKVVRTINGVDGGVFYPDGVEARPKQIAVMPRRQTNHLEQVVQMLRCRGSLADWKIEVIDGLREQPVADVLRRSSIFLTGAVDQGFGLPPLEAALCGCLIVGYTGSGADEFLTPEFAWPVPQNDILAFAQAVEEVLDLCRREPETVANRRRTYAAYLRERYSLEREQESVLSAWQTLRPECFHP